MTEVEAGSAGLPLEGTANIPEEREQDAGGNRENSVNSPAERDDVGRETRAREASREDEVERDRDRRGRSRSRSRSRSGSGRRRSRSRSASHGRERDREKDRGRERDGRDFRERRYGDDRNRYDQGDKKRFRGDGPGYGGGAHPGGFNRNDRNGRGYQGQNQGYQQRGGGGNYDRRDGRDRGGGGYGGPGGNRFNGGQNNYHQGSNFHNNNRYQNQGHGGQGHSGGYNGRRESYQRDQRDQRGNNRDYKDFRQNSFNNAQQNQQQQQPRDGNMHTSRFSAPNNQSNGPPQGSGPGHAHGQQRYGDRNDRDYNKYNNQANQSQGMNQQGQGYQTQGYRQKERERQAHTSNEQRHQQPAGPSHFGNRNFKDNRDGRDRDRGNQQQQNYRDRGSHGAPYQQQNNSGRYDCNDVFKEKRCSQFDPKRRECHRKVCQFFPCYMWKSPNMFDCTEYKNNGRCLRKRCGFKPCCWENRENWA